MTRDETIHRLQAHEAELRALGVARLSLFGSVAREEAGPSSDVDLAAEFDPAARVGAFRFVAIADRLRALLGTSVDLVGEPARRPRMQASIDRDRVRVF
jgi:hypothetical protein